MDAGLFLLLPAGAEVPHTSIRTNTREWGGEEHRQGPDELLFGEHCVVVEDRLSDWAELRLPEALRSLAVYLIKGDGLDRLQLELMGHEAGRPDLRELLQRALASQTTWALVFLWHWDSLDRIVAATPAEAIAMLESNLAAGANRIGFAAYNLG